MWHVETDYFALIVFLIMYIKEFMQRRSLRQREAKEIKDSWSTQSESFYYVLLFSIICTLVDILSSTAMNCFTNWWVYQILMTIYVITMPLFAIVWVGYSFILIHQDKPIKKSLKKVIVLMIPYFAFILLALTNPFTGLFFTLSQDMEYSRGILFMSVGVGSIMFYSAIGLLIVLSNWKKFSARHDAVLLVIFFLFTGILIWVQLAHPGWLIIDSSYAVIYVVCDIFIEDERSRELYREIENKNLELQKSVLEAKEANAAKTTFLSNISHDIRTPMNAIVGITNLMEHEKNNPEKMETYIRKVQLSSKHLLNLVNDVLDMSKIESEEASLNSEPFSLAEQVWQVESIIRPTSEESEQDFSIDIHRIYHEYLIGDAVRLRQIFINLLSNAVKYTPVGGKINFELSEKTSKNHDFAEFLVRVSDNGQGMSKKFLKHIWEPFSRAENSVTNKIQGTGLGMAITKNIVDMMGGSIAVKSELGKGSCFEVNLKFKINKNEKTDFPFNSVLLISDDDVLVENATVAFSNEKNVELYVAKSEEEADKIFAEKNVEIVLLGSSLGMQKLEDHVHRIRKVSGNALMFYCCKYQERKQLIGIENKGGVDGVVVRPFFISTLKSTIEGLVCQKKDDPKPGDSILKGMKFLCAEDNELNAEILRAVLDIRGASCDIYSNGRLLLDAFENVKEGDYDAILMDVKMPVMDGLSATRIIREGDKPLGRTIPIVAMTANAFSSDVQDCLEAGMDAHVSKPLDIGVLERTIKNLKKR